MIQLSSEGRLIKKFDAILLTERMNHCLDTTVPPRLFGNWSNHASMVYPDYTPPS